MDLKTVIDVVQPIVTLGGFGVVLYMMKSNKRKTDAESGKIGAETEKLNAEAERVRAENATYIAKETAETSIALIANLRQEVADLTAQLTAKNDEIATLTEANWTLERAKAAKELEVHNLTGRLAATEASASFWIKRTMERLAQFHFAYELEMSRMRAEVAAASPYMIFKPRKDEPTHDLARRTPL